MSLKTKKIGILTGGGDCPGLNAVIRGVAKSAINVWGMEVIGIEDGFEGFVESKKIDLDENSVSGILSIGGTILGSSNKADPFRYPVTMPDGKLNISDASKQVLFNYEKWELDAVVAIGGDGTMNIAKKLGDMGMNIVGVPKTIDNDLQGTDVTFGFMTAVDIATEAIDRLHTTASSHHRVMVIEVMGRYAGWIALHAGVAGGGDIILIPEIPFQWEAVYDKVRSRSRKGKRFSIVVVAEGAHAEKEELVVKGKDATRTDPKRLGGVGNYVAQKITENTGLETRVTVLGHLQRGGSPSAFDRILSTRFGTEASRLINMDIFGKMVALKGQDIVDVPVEEAIKGLKLVPRDCNLVLSAKSVGTCFGVND
ncbi:6-phosphofructokinase [candidate division WOR-3 bacterium]|nr:6-phosphofructokinase [candidate division WOR-3 bacterium]